MSVMCLVNSVQVCMCVCVYLCVHISLECPGEVVVLAGDGFLPLGETHESGSDSRHLLLYGIELCQQDVRGGAGINKVPFAGRRQQPLQLLL